nr:hypothetical protein [Armatimonas sp.]
MPKVFLPIALMVLGTIKLPGEHHFNDAEAEHATEQLERLGHGTQPVAASPVVPAPVPQVTPKDALETLAAFLQQGEISSEEVAERLGFVIGTVVDKAEEEPAKAEPETPLKTESEPPPELVIPPAVVKELVKAGFILVKPETIQAANDEALLAVKGMTPELLAVVRQIVE